MSESNGHLLIECGPPDTNGVRSVVAKYGKRRHQDKFDPSDAFKRSKFCERVVRVFEWDQDAQEHVDAKVQSAAEAESAALFKPVIKLLSEFKPKPVRWLWRNRIAIGKNNLLCGDPGLGKSLCMLDLAARATTDIGFPDGSHCEFGPAGVVVLTMEDDPEDTLVPRLIAAKADLTRMAIVQGMSEADGDGKVIRGIDLATDLAAVREAVLRVPNCRLIIVDTIADYLGTKVDSHKNPDVRSVMNPFAAMANELGVANLSIAHMRKTEGRAVHSAMGSIAFIGQSRVAWAITRCPQNKKRRLMTCIKNNLADDTSGLAYTIESYGDDGQPVLAWEAESVRMSADEAMASTRKPPGPKPTERANAVEWLASYLSDGPQPAGDIASDATANGINVRTLRRAFDELGCKRRKGGFGGGWEWWLPEDDTEHDEVAVRSNLSPSSPSTNPEDNTTTTTTTNKTVRVKGTSSPGVVPSQDLINFEAERLTLSNGHSNEPPF